MVSIWNSCGEKRVSSNATSLDSTNTGNLKMNHSFQWKIITHVMDETFKELIRLVVVQGLFTRNPGSSYFCSGYYSAFGRF